MGNWTPEQFAQQMASNDQLGIDTSATAPGHTGQDDRIAAKFGAGDARYKKTEMDSYKTELDLQQAIVEWFEWLSITDFPALATLYAIPNQIAPGRRPAPGQLSGMPDLCLPVARGPFHSLYIEVKQPGEYPRKNQKAIHVMLREQGHAVAVVRSVGEAETLVRQYMAGELAPF